MGGRGFAVLVAGLLIVGTVLLAQGGGVGGGVSLLGAISYGQNGAYPMEMSNPAAGLMPVFYTQNGQFPEPLKPNPSAGMRPVEYRGNGQFPEALAPSPSAGMRPVAYNANGQFPEPAEPNPSAGLRPVYYNENGQARPSSCCPTLSAPKGAAQPTSSVSVYSVSPIW
ncbi:hypothetical protein T484DRAFT_1787148 [Baffinella frigidus]|nr:hypothetical protein T484DRAFT_1787148 [Cryptophyta sp. CCMP2293]